jgi:hypothetical protein
MALRKENDAVLNGIGVQLGTVVVIVVGGGRSQLCTM